MTRPPRERIVYAAAQSVRQRGVAATGLRGVVAEADAPRGSLQHYFPGGKEQLVGEALRWSGDYAADQVRRFARELRKPSPGSLFAAMAGQWRDEFRRRGFQRGCPLLAATADVAGTDASLRDTVRVGFDGWLAAVRQELRRMGVPTGRADSLAVLMISALEGAIVLARINQDVRPLTTVVRQLKPLLDQAVES